MASKNRKSLEAFLTGTNIFSTKSYKDLEHHFKHDSKHTSNRKTIKETLAYEEYNRNIRKLANILKHQKTSCAT